MITSRHFDFLTFEDYPEFRPNLSPREIFELGSFGGTYWRPIHSTITNKDYKDVYLKYPDFKGMDKRLLARPLSEYDTMINKYNVKVGSSLEEWEDKGWITTYDPYGWVQWYTEFYNGRRCSDDPRQIKRWQSLTRFINRLNNIRKKGDDSPAIRQTLQHWAIKT